MGQELTLSRAIATLMTETGADSAHAMAADGGRFIRAV